MKQFGVLLYFFCYLVSPMIAQNPNLKVGEIVKDWCNGTIAHLKEDGAGLVYQNGSDADLLTRNKVKLFPFNSLMKVGEALDIKFAGKDILYIATYENAGKIFLLFIQSIKDNAYLTRIELNSAYKEIARAEILQIPNWKFDPRAIVVNWNTEKSALTISSHSELIAISKNFGKDEDWIKSHHVILVNSSFTKASTYEYSALHILELNPNTYQSKVTEIGYKDSKNRITQPAKQIGLPLEKIGKLVFTGSKDYNFSVGSYKIQIP